MPSSSSSQELYAVAGKYPTQLPVLKRPLIQVQDFCLVPVGTGPDPSVRGWKDDIRELFA